MIATIMMMAIMDPLLIAPGIPNSKLEIPAEETGIEVQAESGGEITEEQGVEKKGQEVEVELEEWEGVGHLGKEAEAEHPEKEEVGHLEEEAEVNLQKEAEAMKEEEVKA